MRLSIIYTMTSPPVYIIIISGSGIRLGLGSRLTERAEICDQESTPGPRINRVCGCDLNVFSS